ncbi:hypothetical protein LZ31DRAFT_558048 [Colletotrichum somersetense]|nr:hypothetical protein LZ31DRAFT_558048 [Colletotrichum somersetense]
MFRPSWIGPDISNPRRPASCFFASLYSPARGFCLPIKPVYFSLPSTLTGTCLSDRSKLWLLPRLWTRLTDSLA